MKLKYILLVLMFLLLLAAAVLGYQLLTAMYSPPVSVPDATEEAREAAPDFTVYDIDGNKVSLSSFLGSPVVVNFWATWCGPCQSELPAFDILSREYDGTVSFMMVDLTDGERETVDSVSTFIENNGYSFPVYYDLDLDACYTYQTYSIPYTVFISSDGSLFATHTGAMNEDTLRNYIQSLLEESHENHTQP